MSQFKMGFRAVMSSAFNEAKLSFWQVIFMDHVVYAGAAQLASVDLMKMNAALFVVIATGLIINLRYVLYSVAKRMLVTTH